MSLEQLANIAEVFGMLVVAITLIFLTLQMRQNTHAMKVASAQNFVNLYNTFTGHLSSSKELADLWYKGLSDYSSLTAGDRVRVSCANGQLMRIYESAYLQWCEGALDDQLWTAFLTGLKDTGTTPGLRQWWQTRRQWYSHNFRFMVDETFAKQEGTNLYPDFNEAYMSASGR